MIKLTERLSHQEDNQKNEFANAISSTLSLPIDMRVRSRVKVKLDDGREAGLFLDRGSLLRGGDLLRSAEGDVIKILAAKEKVSSVYCDNGLQLAKAAYHLGNRHVPLQVESNFLRYQHDQVLDDMLIQMGLEVIIELASFEPEAGAYLQTSAGHHHHD